MRGFLSTVQLYRCILSLTLCQSSVITQDLKRLSRSSSGCESQSARGCGGRGGPCLILLRKVLGFPGAIGCRHVLSHQAVGASLVHLRLTSYAVSPSILMLGRSRCRSASSRDGLSRFEGQLERGLAGSGQYARALWFRGLSCRPFHCWQGHTASIYQCRCRHRLFATISGCAVAKDVERSILGDFDGCLANHRTRSRGDLARLDCCLCCLRGFVAVSQR